jgi:hypothetical protein
MTSGIDGSHGAAHFQRLYDATTRCPAMPQRVSSLPPRRCSPSPQRPGRAVTESMCWHPPARVGHIAEEVVCGEHFRGVRVSSPGLSTVRRRNSAHAVCLGNAHTDGMRQPNIKPNFS